MNGNTKHWTKKMASPSHKEVCRIFYMVKGHLGATEKTMRDCYNGYFKRLWYNNETYLKEEGFEEEYEKFKMKQKQIYDDTQEDLVWKNVDPNDIWVMDKLILSRKLGYNCGPVGLDVPHAGLYIVRPCINMLGLGLGAKQMWLDKDTTHLPIGHFWCEWFEGLHLSVDYNWGIQRLCVEGRKDNDTLTRWNEWIKVTDNLELPDLLTDLGSKYEWLNCEYIDGNLIEVHLRKNEDFEGGINHFIPVWEGQSTTPPDGYTYKSYPDMHGRIGAFVK